MGWDGMGWDRMGWVCVCVGNPESKGVSRGATPHLPMLPDEATEDVVEGFVDA